MLLSIPSPPFNSFNLGPLTIRIYALTMLAAIVVAYLIASRRFRNRGGAGEDFDEIVLWAVPFGIVGARIYHVITHWGDYFAPGVNPWSAFFIWEGGIAVFGSLMGGALGAWIGCRRTGVRLLSFGDALAPALPVAQAVGRLGNWFNQELFGGPTDLPWGLEIDAAHRPPGLEQYATFHPTFLYELLLNLAAAALLLWADRRFRLGHGQTLSLYIVCYGIIRFFIEGMRTDFSYYLGPLRTNQITALILALVGVVAFVWLRRAFPGREESIYRVEARPAGADDQ
nr:prolipoprotein diacylglyceryl transferase [Nigerium massiliense]